MKLFKILNAIDKGSRLLSEEKLKLHGTSHLERYANTALNTKTLTHDIKIVEKRATIGGQFVDDISRNLKLGNIGILNKIYKINEIPRPLSIRALEDVKNLPSAKVGDVERIGKMFKEKARTKLPNDTFEQLNRPGRDLRVSDVEQNNLIKNLVDELQKRNNIKPFTGTGFVFASLSTALFVSTFNKRQRDLRGCHAYYTDDTGNVLSCKLPTCSCDGKGGFNSKCNASCKVCPQEILNLLPPSMTNNIKACVDVNEPCVNCPAKEFEEAHIANIDNESADFQTITPTDKVYIKCINPSVLDTFVDIFGDLGDNILGLADNAVGATSFFFKHIKSILIVCGVLVTIVSVAVAIFKFGGKNDRYIQIAQEVR